MTTEIDSGDYGKIAWLTVPLADALCDAVALRPGSAVLDVATVLRVVRYLPVPHRLCYPPVPPR